MAFPTTSVIDSGTGSDTAAPADWTIDNNLFTNYRSAATNSGIGRASNRFKANTGGWQMSYRTGADVSSDCEVYCTLPVLPADGDEAILHARLSGIGANFYSYKVIWGQNAGTSFTLKLQKVVNGNAFAISQVDPGASATGQKFGLECIGTAINAYWWDGATWTQELSETDSDVTAAGKLALEIRNTTARVTDFAGTVVPGSTAARDLTLLGVG